MKKTLHLSTDNELEDLLFEGMSRDIFRGEISQIKGKFYVTYSRARDCLQQQREHILANLRKM